MDLYIPRHLLTRTPIAKAMYMVLGKKVRYQGRPRVVCTEEGPVIMLKNIRIKLARNERGKIYANIYVRKGSNRYVLSLPYVGHVHVHEGVDVGQLHHVMDAIAGRGLDEHLAKCVLPNYEKLVLYLGDGKAGTVKIEVPRDEIYLIGTAIAHCRGKTVRKRELEHPEL